MSREFPVRGVNEVVSYLDAFGPRFKSGAVRAGLTAAAAPVRDRARQLARKRSGKMARSIKSGSPRDNRDGTFSITIRLQGPHAFLGLFFENGVAPHFLQGGDGGLSARTLTQKLRRAADEAGVLRIGDQHISGAVMHPGLVASPFMRPALDMEAQASVTAFTVRVRDYLEGKTGFRADLPDAA